MKYFLNSNNKAHILVVRIGVFTLGNNILIVVIYLNKYKFSTISTGYNDRLRSVLSCGQSDGALHTSSHGDTSATEICIAGGDDEEGVSSGDFK